MSKSPPEHRTATGSSLVRILVLACLLMSGLIHAASPSFNSFLTTQFTNNGVKIGLNTNFVMTWEMVSTNSFTTNGNSLAINTNTFPKIPTVADMIQRGALQFNPNQFATNGGFVSITNTPAITNLAQFGRFRSANTDTTNGVFLGNATLQRLYIGSSVFSTVINAGLTIQGGSNLWSIAAVGSIPSQLNKSLLFFNDQNAGYAMIVNGDDNKMLLGGSPTILAAVADLDVRGSLGTIRMTNLLFGADSTTQKTGATNAVRIFAGTGTTLTRTNNTANGSIDIRVDSSGAGAGSKTFQRWTAVDAIPSSTNFATFYTSGNNWPVPVMLFDHTTQMSTVFSGPIPEGVDLSSGITVRVYWGAASTSGNVGWTVALRNLSGQTTDSAWGSPTNTITAVTVPGTATTTTNSSVNFSSGQLPTGLAAGSWMQVLILRDIATDTMTGNAALRGVEVRTQ